MRKLLKILIDHCIDFAAEKRETVQHKVFTVDSAVDESRGVDFTADSSVE